jgi:nucleotide-binding universal stress UspA family protein
MKALIGVDTAGISESAVRLFARLKFPGAETTLLNVADLVLPYTSFGIPPSLEPTNDLIEGLQRAGRSAVQEAARVADAFGLATKQEVVSGPSVLSLLDRAKTLGADLIAVSSTRKGALLTLFAGSMSRSIVTSSKIPVLVAKEGVKDSGPVDVVLATDHSSYAERAVEQLLKFAPAGIGKVHVVSAYEVTDKEARTLHANLPQLEDHIGPWIQSQMEAKCQALVGKLSQRGYESDYSVAHGDPNQVIADALQRTGAELLILGAQGHGFIDRLFVGSVSFHQLVAAPYSVFVLRDE